MVEQFFGALEECVRKQARKMREERTEMLRRAVEASGAGDEELCNELMEQAFAIGERLSEASEQLPAVLGAAAVSIKKAFSQVGVDLPPEEYILEAYRQFLGEPNAIDAGDSKTRQGMEGIRQSLGDLNSFSLTEEKLAIPIGALFRDGDSYGRRVGTVLQRGGALTTVGDVLRKSESELCAIGSFRQNSLERLLRGLYESGFVPKTTLTASDPGSEF